MIVKLFVFSVFSIFIMFSLATLVVSESSVIFSKDKEKKNKKIKWFCVGVGAIVSILVYSMAFSLPDDLPRWIFGLSAGSLATLFTIWIVKWWPFVWENFKQTARWS